ncbi:helix-turn-helix transcriptional regulator [Aquitalea sp. ASV11]|uniref:helix-turn-helix domain-containing protein n=1 Tax=Aquitalea sp. ASV11 TaxID=2795103 RepID=UPI0018EDD10C|nr:helix-turn-helix transcriptional regulator [Aquitalea sp. ASV11]
MLSLLDVLSSTAQRDIPVEDKPALLAELRQWLADNVAREQIRQAVLDRLTGREVEVLLLMAAGLSYRDAAQRLGISQRTLRQHLGSCKDKLGLLPPPGQTHVDTRQLVARVFGLDFGTGIGGSADARASVFPAQSGHHDSRMNAGEGTADDEP